jgi:hypothetical protein
VKNKDRFSKIIEIFINEHRRDVMDYMFGINSKVIIKNFDYSFFSKMVVIDATVILGESIDELMIESSDIISELIKESMEYISYDYKLAITVSFDV